MRDLYIALVYLSFLVLGAGAPFVFALGYIWVDAFNPQYVSGLLGEVPVSLIMAAATIGGYLMFDRRYPPRFTLSMGLTLAFAAWVTITMMWAEAGDFAWVKWNWAFKTVIFSAFIPFFFRSRVQIEAFISVYLFALSVQLLPIGLKTMLSGGGYGQALGIVGGNSGFSEGSQLAAVALMTVPLLLFLRQHGQLVPRLRLHSALYLGLVAVALVAAVGTFERTGLVGLVVLAGASWLKARRKVVFGIGVAAAALLVLAVSSDRWTERMGTIKTFEQESSALTRLLVWGWTWQYVQSHPLGGGFNSYVKSVIVYPGTDENPEPHVVYGRAFHSVYFEVLGEQGFVGLGLFAGLVATTLLSLRRIARRTRAIPELAWCRDLAGALQVSLLVLLTCGAFVGIAFQPMFYTLFAAAVCVGEYVRRTQDQDNPQHRARGRIGARPVAAVAAKPSA